MIKQLVYLLIVTDAIAGAIIRRYFNEIENHTNNNVDFIILQYGFLEREFAVVRVLGSNVCIQPTRN